MDDTNNRETTRESIARLVTMAVVGIVVGAGLAIVGLWDYAIISGWAAACLVFIAWVWLSIGGMDAERTRSHATREDPDHRISDLLLVLAALVSVVVVIFVLVRANTSQTDEVGVAITAVLSVALSWFLIHTLFTLRYARLYYAHDGTGIDFNQKEKPRYTDFAYLSFTLGMTFQVSDTDLGNHVVRATALRHGLLSYLFGSVILATLINLIGGLTG
ncbi:DUF1345 domain-containing protein [Compostimonas suwonensis]|uniref:Putative membrane protein n=1 Tax=Compostimonas suwonensis TaxID=1048394 RepID=A0A2M9C552_9MICO|nr:DUF1345 domain-containing protein [Compostimonas suwonensis]PJJ65661.1 putative membrane protein [Compostimonas suwonensis]